MNITINNFDLNNSITLLFWIISNYVYLIWFCSDGFFLPQDRLHRRVAPPTAPPGCFRFVAKTIYFIYYIIRVMASAIQLNVVPKRLFFVRDNSNVNKWAMSLLTVVVFGPIPVYLRIDGNVGFRTKYSKNYCVLRTIVTGGIRAKLWSLPINVNNGWNKIVFFYIIV